MYRLSANITISTSQGNLVFDYVHALEVTHSVESLTDTCTITLPRNLNLKDKNIRDIIQAGDQVNVEIGYNDENNQVFAGFVRNIKPGTPVVITCEDRMYELKKLKVADKHYPGVTLSSFLQEWMPLDVTISVADINLGELRITGEPSLSRVLDQFTQDYGLRFFFRDGTFYGVLPSTMAALDGVETHKLKLSWNTLENYTLDYIKPDDVEVIIKAKAITKENVKLEVQEPEGETDGEVRTYFSDSAQTEADLRIFAQEKLKTFKDERVEGSVTCFGLPYVMAADRVYLMSDRDDEFNDKTFLVKEVKRTFGMQGYRQVLKLGAKIS